MPTHLSYWEIVYWYNNDIYVVVYCPSADQCSWYAGRQQHPAGRQVFDMRHSAYRDPNLHPVWYERLISAATTTSVLKVYCDGVLFFWWGKVIGCLRSRWAGVSQIGTLNIVLEVNCASWWQHCLKLWFWLTLACSMYENCTPVNFFLREADFYGVNKTKKVYENFAVNTLS